MQCITVHAMFFYVKCTSLTKVVPNKLNEDLPLSVWVDSNTSVPKTKILKCSDFSWNSLTWSGCGLPHRQVCLAPSVQEPLFRSRGPEGSSPSARSGWSRTSRRHQIPQSTLWTKNIWNPEIKRKEVLLVMSDFPLQSEMLRRATWRLPGIFLEPVGNRGI